MRTLRECIVSVQSQSGLEEQEKEVPKSSNDGFMVRLVTRVKEFVDSSRSSLNCYILNT